MTVSAASLFETFNARLLDPSVVAGTFVPPRHYESISRAAHTLIVGPRGSGKTTLLKMLQSQALEAWRGPDADMYRRRIRYTGVFIPTDRSWSAQIDALGSESATAVQAELFAGAAFTTHVLRALVAAMEYRVHPPDKPALRPHRRVSLSRQGEAELVKSVGETWNLKTATASLPSLRQALTGRLVDIHSIGTRERLSSEDGRSQRLANEPSLRLQAIVEPVCAALELFADISQVGSEQWALLFDELELAPLWIVTRLLESLRSVDQRLLFKLSLSPFGRHTDALRNIRGAMAGQDFDSVALWYPKKEDAYEFSSALLASLLRKRDISKTSREAFGMSEIDVRPGEWRRQAHIYKKGSRAQKRFELLSKIDPTFASYLKKREIDPDRLQDVPDPERAQDVRKIASLVWIRVEFRSHGHRRSRKKPTIYFGDNVLCAACEGNPRWLIGIVDKLLTGAKFGQVTRQTQSAELNNAAGRFRALLRTIPCPPVFLDRESRGLISLLDRIGEAFHREAVDAPFSADPFGSFIVDSNSSEALLASLGEALNAGAIVYIPDEAGDQMLSSLKGKRFRLSHLLGAYYYLPLILLRPVSLGWLLKRAGKRDGTALQGDLFSGESL